MRRALSLAAVLTVAFAKCPMPYQPWVHGRCLQASPNPLTYSQAADTCQSESGTLASIHSAEDNANIAKATYNYDYHIFLGLQCNRTTNKFEWVDGTPLDYSNFQSGLPATCNTAPQVTFDPKTGVWSAFSDAGYNSYLCEYPRDDEYPCDQGYDYVAEAGLCVQAYNFASAWNDAEQTCQNIDPNSHLVSIHSDEGNNALAQYALSKGFSGGIHIGLSKQNGASQLAWSDGTDVDYSSFQPGMPIDAFGQCVAQRSQTSKWLSVHCDNTDPLPFLCAVPAFTPNATIQPPGCPDNAYFINGGDILSPGYPISIAAVNLTCDYFLYGDEGTHVTLTFDVFELNACCDSLEIYEGVLATQPTTVLTGELMEGYEIATYSDNVMHLVLKIGDGQGVRGFHGTFTTNNDF